MAISQADRYTEALRLKVQDPSISNCELSRKVGVSESCIRNWLANRKTPRNVRIEEERFAKAKPVALIIPAPHQKVADQINNGSKDSDDSKYAEKTTETINKRNKLAVELLGEYYDLFPKRKEAIEEVYELLRNGEMNDVERATLWMRYDRMIGDVIKEMHAMGMPSLAPFANGDGMQSDKAKTLDSGMSFIEQIRSKRNG